MGGLGSGRWYRWQGRTMTLEEVPRLDVRWLYRQGYVQSGARGVRIWHGGERPLGVVGVTVEDDRMGVAALCGFIKLERLKMSTKLNHFALKSTLYLNALRSAFATLRTLTPAQGSA